MIKEFIDNNKFNITAAIMIVVLILVIVLSTHFVPFYTTQSTIIGIGYKGVTVECKGEYGEDLILKVDVDNVSKYQIGDTITIKIKAFNGVLKQSVEIVEERDNEPN